MSELSDIIERGYDHGGRLEDPQEQQQLEGAVQQAITSLDAGESRVAEYIDGDWQVNQWLKKAVLLSFRLTDNDVVEGNYSKFFDKVPMKRWSARRARRDCASRRICRA
jgi:2,3,4,5-tetrahydropyridine-2-carboxylate N-succinyltransferase